MQKQNMKQSRFFCTKCGNEGLPVMRNVGQQREPGHLKKLYCIYCKEETNHAEIREIGGYTIENFQQEFNLGRFVNGKREPLMECSKIDCPFNINGKCWNSNDSARCKHKPQKENKNEEDTKEN